MAKPPDPFQRDKATHASEIVRSTCSRCGVGILGSMRRVQEWERKHIEECPPAEEKSA